MVLPKLNPGRRGPHSELSDAQLHNRRDQLVQLFEGDWGRIGPKLQKGKKPDDLIGTFSPLLNSYADEIISVFCRPSNETPTRKTLGKVRRDLRSLVKPSYVVDESKRRASLHLQQVDWALDKASRASRKIVRRAQKKARKEAGKIEHQSRTLLAEERLLKERLRKLEASYARQEIFKFIASERYDLNPLSLANAMANVPYSGWRQSMKRATRVPSKIGNGLSYQIFKAIRFLTTSANKKSANAIVASFRAGIRSLPSRHRLAKRELAKNWYFLERAIRLSCKTKTPQGELHFAIAEQYSKLVRSVSQVEWVVAEYEKIDLSQRSMRGPTRRPK